MRKPEFDRDDVLDAAQQMFWRKGYEATTLPDLLQATGLARQSLYNAFGDKRPVPGQLAALRGRTAGQLVAGARARIGAGRPSRDPRTEGADMGKLTGKVAVVTGGTTGLGLATARLFAAEGAKVIATGRNPETLAGARKELAGAATVVQSDAGDPEQVRKLFGEVGREHRRIDVLFLNAGIAQFAPIADSREDLFDETLRVNLRGPFLASDDAAFVTGHELSVDGGMLAA